MIKLYEIVTPEGEPVALVSQAAEFEHDYIIKEGNGFNMGTVATMEDIKSKIGGIVAEIEEEKYDAILFQKWGFEPDAFIRTLDEAVLSEQSVDSEPAKDAQEALSSESAESEVAESIDSETGEDLNQKMEAVD